MEKTLMAMIIMLIGAVLMFAGLWVAPSFEGHPANTVNLCTIQDVNGDSLEIKVNSGEVWQQILEMHRTGQRKWVGGKLINATNVWGFTFDPDTIIVAEFTAEGLQTTLEQIRENPYYWFNIPGGICYIGAIVIKVNTSIITPTQVIVFLAGVGPLIGGFVWYEKVRKR
ncbi:MAG: hypothetical protein ACUVRA_03305 [Candidatus Bathyarchaeaceae archaeon]